MLVLCSYDTQETYDVFLIWLILAVYIIFNEEMFYRKLGNPMYRFSYLLLNLFFILPIFFFLCVV